jgi:hypothetical protein
MPSLLVKMGSQGIKGNDWGRGRDESTVIYCKNFFKCHNVPPVQQQYNNNNNNNNNNKKMDSH